MQVPLRRVNPAYLIGTSVTVDISKVNLSKVDDALFKAPKKLKEKKSEAGFFKEDEKKEVRHNCKDIPLRYDDPVLRFCVWFLNMLFIVRFCAFGCIKF